MMMRYQGVANACTPLAVIANAVETTVSPATRKTLAVWVFNRTLKRSALMHIP
jgi:hypothetical protein